MAATTDRGSTRPARRPASVAGRLLLRLLGVILAIPLWIAWVLFILFLPLVRPLVQFPLALATLVGFAAGAYFGLHHAWGDAIRATVVGAISSAALVAVTALAETIDPDFSRPPPLPPWWWYF